MNYTVPCEGRQASASLVSHSMQDPPPIVSAFDLADLPAQEALHFGRLTQRFETVELFRQRLVGEQGVNLTMTRAAQQVQDRID